MIQRLVETYSSYKIFITKLCNQLFVNVSVTKKDKNPEYTISEIYNKLADLLSASSSQIVQERCFTNIKFQKQILEARASALCKHALETDTPITFVEGESCLGNKFAGIQIRAIKPTPENRVWTILDQGIPKGRAWTHDNSTFIVLQSIDGGNSHDIKLTDRKFQSEAMFHQAEKLLHAEGASYRDVVRTWIYISNILDWYNDFNTIRNNCYSEYGFLGNAKIQAEQMYLPASTGIEGRNPSGYPATMDVFAIHRSPGSVIQIYPLYGVKQRSPFRYGSAFSRATIVKEPGIKLILVSGTASIDDRGASMFPGDPEAQIRQTLSVISELVASEGATFQDLCEATVFIKRKEDFLVFQEVIEDMGITNMPSVNVLADVCRDELLFELDAAFIVAKD